MVERATRLRRHRPMVMIDLAVPRDIEPKSAAWTTSTCIRWTTWAAWCRPAPTRAAPPWCRPRPSSKPVSGLHALDAIPAVVPVIRDLHQAAEDVRAAELERARRMLARGESPEAVLEQLAHGLTQKYLHGPLAA